MPHKYVHSMAKKRTRDAVWDAALMKTVKMGEKTTPAEVAELADVSERTVRDVLNVMADSGWLRRKVLNDSTVQYWHPPEITWEP